MRNITEGEVIALAAALAGEGGGGTGDGDMKMSVYDSTEEVKDAGGIKNFVNGAISDLQTATVNSITDVGTLPSIVVEGENMTISVGTLPTKGEDITVIISEEV